MLEDVIAGLILGYSYERTFGRDGVETVRALGGRRFEHAVSSNGSGGVAELDISCLSNGHWAANGWQRI